MGGVDSSSADDVLTGDASSRPSGPGGRVGVPPTVGPYPVLLRLGQGGFGVVYLACDPLLDRVLAVKVLHSSTVQDAEIRDRLHLEARAAAKVQHPNVVTVFGVDLRGEPPYIAMEFVRGLTLAETVREGGFALPALVEVAIQTARGLNAAHREGIVHRDIKPQNLRLSVGDGDEMWVKIVDFGLARQVFVPGAKRVISGTRGFIAPEVLQGGADDGRADLFSLGVVLYWAATAGRRLPFPGRTFDEVRERTLKEPAAPLPELRGTRFAWLEPLVLGCLEKDPDRRPQTGREVAGRLRAGAEESRTRGSLRTDARAPVRTRGSLVTRTRGPVTAPAVQVRARLVLRGAGHARAPAAGELLVRPGAGEDPARDGLATLVCESGIARLVAGAPPIERVVVPVQATLDEMLAGELVLRVAGGEEVPPGARKLAHYAARLRRAPHPLAFPLGQSPEGILLAMRCLEGGDLGEPEAAERFLRQWSRLGMALLGAAEEDLDPFQVPFLAEDPEFDREREFLRQDRERLAADLARAERWDAPVPAGALFVDGPRSELVEHWLAEDPEAAGASGLVAVRREGGRWSLLARDGGEGALPALSEVLTGAEGRLDAGRWAVEASLRAVVSPAGGSRLPVAEVLIAVRAWVASRDG